MLQPTADECFRRDAVRTAILEHVRADRAIHLPDFDPNVSQPSEKALLTIGAEPNDFSGEVGEHRYQFEGEEDLLHLIVTRVDGGPVTPEEGQAVCGFALPGVPHGLIWFRPGELSQHFYVGHDVLLESPSA